MGANDGYGQMLGYSLGNTKGTGSAAGAQRTLVYDAAGRITGFVHNKHNDSDNVSDNGHSVAALQMEEFGSQQALTLVRPETPMVDRTGMCSIQVVAAVKHIGDRVHDCQNRIK